MADPTAFVSGLVHEPTQVREGGLDLTVAAVHEPTSPGAVDFGGGELAPAGRTELSPERRAPEDDYGWWELTPGTYFLEYNERLTDPPTVALHPRVELVERGASHPTLRTDRLPAMPLSVGDGGLHLKENARVSTLRVP